jgi:hypothetical protein
VSSVRAGIAQFVDCVVKQVPLDGAEHVGAVEVGVNFRCPGIAANAEVVQQSSSTSRLDGRNAWAVRSLWAYSRFSAATSRWRSLGCFP